MMKTAQWLLLMALIYGSAGNGAESLVTIADVTTSKSIFDPAKEESVEIRFQLPHPSTVTISVYDPDRKLVRILLNKARRPAGPNRDTWNGKNMDGRVVPNEAYFFVIEATDASGHTAVYDPVTFSGGEFGDVGGVQVDRGSGTISYSLSQPSRVLLRAGIAGSSMLKTIVDWEPRAAGAITEYWNGKDEDGLIDLMARKHTLVLTYTTLPANSVIAYGNDKYTYRQYRASWKTDRPSKPERPMVNHRQISPHFGLSRLKDRSFRVKVDAPAAIGAGEERVMVRVDVDPRDREVLGDQQFEIILFVDTVFHTEEERGYLPFNVPIELAQLPPGEHVITANVITFGDQIGVGSRKVTVRR
jgi:hypothetical protein